MFKCEITRIELAGNTWVFKQKLFSKGDILSNAYVV